MASLVRRSLRGRVNKALPQATPGQCLQGPAKPSASTVILAVIFAVLVLAAPAVHPQSAACLECHGAPGMTDASGHSITVDGNTFSASVHGGLGCTVCHTDIKGYPHPAHVAPVQCSTCHADQASALSGSVHADGVSQCSNCHGDPHSIFPKDDPRSDVYPLNIPRTCGACHDGHSALAKKYGLSNVYSEYMDSIHGFALSKEGLLVAANCQACHGSHHILSHNNPQSPTYKTNIPATCGKCHAAIEAKYEAGIHGKQILAGNLKAPVCTDCHTAHSILQPTAAAFRMQSTPICGDCHKAQLGTYRDTFHSQLGLLGGYVQTARCWDCHRAHEILPASDPLSAINKANLVKTCGRCHAGANASFVEYQPHADPRNRKLSPGLYFVRLFMNLLLISVLTFFVIHTLMWTIRSRYIQIKNSKAGEGEKHA